MVGKEMASAADGSGVGLGFHWGGLSGALGAVLGVGRRGEVDEEGKEVVDGEGGMLAPTSAAAARGWDPQRASEGRGCGSHRFSTHRKLNFNRDLAKCSLLVMLMNSRSWQNVRHILQCGVRRFPIV